MDNKTFPTILRDLLNSRGISQKQLADECGTTEATISRYLSNIHKPEFGVVVKIAQVLGVSVDYLCGLTDLAIPKDSLGAELTTLMRCYERASSRDKKLVWGILVDYMTKEEKGNPFTSGYEVEPMMA